MQCHCILDNGNGIMHQKPISNPQFPERRGSGLVKLLTVPEGEGLLYTAARLDMLYLAINMRGCGELHPHPWMAISYDYPTLHTNISIYWKEILKSVHSIIRKKNWINNKQLVMSTRKGVTKAQINTVTVGFRLQ